MLRIVRDGIEIRIRLVPNAGRDEISGTITTSDGSTCLAARVRAIPEKGAANSALEKLVARWLGLPKRSVRLVSGGKSRIKTLHAAGEGDALHAKIVQLLETS